MLQGQCNNREGVYFQERRVYFREGVPLEEVVEGKIKVDVEEEDSFNSGKESVILVINCSICKKSSHESKDCWYKCTGCKNPNHSEKSCWYKDKRENSGDKNAANFSKEDTGGRLFSCMDVMHQSENTQYLDSDCSYHITGDRKAFVQLDEKYFSHLELGDSKKVKFEGQGVLAIHTKEGKVKYIHDIFYSSGISQNLLSVGQIMKKKKRL